MPKADVSALLDQSRTAHLEYRRHTPHMRSIGGRLVTVPGDPVQARAAVERAADLRKQAHDADPQQTDDAWVKDQALGHDHAAVLTFYAEQAAKASPMEQAKAKQHEQAATVAKAKRK